MQKIRDLEAIGEPKTRREIPLTRPSVGEQELEEIRGVLESGWLAQGPKVKEFERQLAMRFGAKYVVATSSCTTSLSLAIDALGLKSAGEVIVPDFTFPATGNVAVRAGSKPVLVDVDATTYAIDTSAMKTAITRRTTAIIPVHPFGHPFEMDEVYEIADKHGIAVIEDAATAFGTKYKGRLVGSSGKAVCFSFHPRKLLTTAEGGCLVTDDKGLYERAVAMRSHGQVTEKDGRVRFLYNGLNYRMSDVHAAIGIAQLSRIDSIIGSRRRQAEVYGDLLRSSKLDVRVPTEESWAYHTYQSYVVVLGSSLPGNEKLSPRLKKKFGVETQVGTYSLGVQPSFKHSISKGTLAVSKKLYRRSLTLPLFESLSEEEQAYVVDSLKAASRL